MTARYEIAPVSLVHAGGTANLRQLNSWKINANTSRKNMRVAGSVDSQGSLLSRARYSADLETADLATLLPLISPRSGLKVSGAATFRFLQRDIAGAFKTGTNHVTWVAANGGAFYVNSISVNQEAEDGAMASAVFVPFSTSGGDPWTITSSVNLDAAPSATFNSVYFLGGVYLDGSEITGIQSQEVDFGIQFEDVVQSIGPYSQTGFVRNTEPVFRIQTTKMSDLASKVAAGFAISSELALYFQKGIVGGDRVAVDQAEHIKISCEAGSIEAADTGGEAPNDAISSWRIYPAGTITINTATEIPTAT